MSASFDASEVASFGRGLYRKSALATTAARVVVKASAEKVKRDAQQRAKGSNWAAAGRLPSYASSIDVDLVGIQAEIGPTVGGPQWGLGDLLEYGTRTTAPQPHMKPALDAEAPNLEKLLLGVAVRVLD